MDLTVAYRNYDTAIVHVGINDIINDVICKAHNISFINNDSIIRTDMYSGGLHVLHSGNFYCQIFLLKILIIF